MIFVTRLATMEVGHNPDNLKNVKRIPPIHRNDIPFIKNQEKLFMLIGF